MELMNGLLYFMIFILGSVFGSFFSLAVYRLPRKEDITHVRSHCTFCNHKLQFLDLIPIWSYLFLGGKCRYCKEKIRPRYLLLEIFSGLVFLCVAISIGVNINSSILDFIKLSFIYLFLCAVFIIGGIDNENYIIHGGTLLYGIIVALGYGLFKAFFYQETMFYHLIGFLAIPIVLLVISLLLRLMMDDEKLPWGFGDIKYLALIGLFMGLGFQIIILLLALIFAFIMTLIKKYRRVPFGYFLSIATAIVIIFSQPIIDVAEIINLTLI